MIGVYKIINTINNKIYVGSSIKLNSRFRRHTYALEKSQHHNPHLQRAWNKYSEDSFEFKIIEQVDDKEILIEREQYWINKLNPEYNIRKIARSNLGLKMSEKSKEIMSIKHSGKNNPFYSKKHSNKVRTHLSKIRKDGRYKGENNNNCTITDMQVRIIKQLKLSDKDTAKLFGIARNTVNRIRNGKRRNT